MENRRRDERFQFRCNGSVIVDGHNFIMESVNISHRGIRITLDKPLLEGTPVTISLHLDPERFNGLFEAPGNVVWCSEDMEAGFEAGISLSPSPSQSDNILKFIEKRFGS